MVSRMLVSRPWPRFLFPVLPSLPVTASSLPTQRRDPVIAAPGKCSQSIIPPLLTRHRVLSLNLYSNDLRYVIKIQVNVCFLYVIIQIPIRKLRDKMSEMS